MNKKEIIKEINKINIIFLNTQKNIKDIIIHENNKILYSDKKI